MNEDDKKAMKDAWQQWHADIDPDLVPTVNFSFEVGFEAGIAHARKPSVTAQSTADAYRMGENGGTNDEQERLAFESWVKGHSWTLSAEWNGVGYIGKAENHYYICPHATITRRMWAAWRDRAALVSVTRDTLENAQKRSEYWKAEHAAANAVIAGLRGENAVLADILRDADEVLRVIEADDSDESDSLRDLRMAISYALEPYKANGDLLI